MIPPAVIDQVAANLQTCTAAGMATLCEEIGSYTDLCNPDVVKVVRDAQGMALYFSRAIIPWPRDLKPDGSGPLPVSGQWLRHIGIYAYRAELLRRFVTWPPAPQEQLEKLEQLRALHHGVGVHVDIACEAVPPGIDTADDLAAARRLLAGEP
jgi:3-deoxy-manno-octulosonate cytidylyltransferase (CMP-KDO synthetase)